MSRAGTVAPPGGGGLGVAGRQATIAALCAVTAAIGLGRFAYTPLIPAVIGAGWFPLAEAGYLGAANLAGYLAGALLGPRLPALVPTRWLLRGFMLAVVAATVACAWPAGFAWFFLWRFVAGISGGVLMVVAAPGALRHVPAARRGMAGGLIFAGVGSGIALSGTAVPLLLAVGLTEAWLGLAALSMLLTAVAWSRWPADDAGAAAAVPAARGPRPPGLLAIALVYGLNAVALVPHMVFIVDFVARDLGRGMAAGAAAWIAFGLGAVAGPLAAGWLADRIGFATAMRATLAVQAVAIGLPWLTQLPAALLASCAIAGAAVPGIVALTLGRVQQIAAAEPRAQRAAWSFVTAAFAVGQAAAAYAFSFALDRGLEYAATFAGAAAILAIALAVDLTSAPGRR